jgi:hypothetical protein
MAEIELSVLKLKAMLGSGIGSLRMLAYEVNAWEQDRNMIGASVRWQF